MSKTVALKRAVGLPGAVMMGLGSVIGTGVFISLGLAAGITGAAMIFALLAAGCLAFCNGLSSAQLAASHPVSGGTYEYGYKYLHPWLGYLAGWLFVCAKSASAATAAIGFGGYYIRLLNLQHWAPWHIGLGVVVFVVLIALLGIQRSSRTNVAIVSVTLFSLIIYIATLLPDIRLDNFLPLFQGTTGSAFVAAAFFEATALMFVAYTGYGRIATLGAEITNPAKNIPKAIVLTLALSFFFYMAVALVSIGTVGSARFYSATVNEAAPLEVVATLFGHAAVARVLAVGAMAAMLGVLLNLVLGLSRVVYAMACKGDLPAIFARVDGRRHAPYMGIFLSGVVIFSLVLFRDIKITWSFSAFTVLFYYAITNLAALRMPKKARLYPKWLAYAGLLGCLSLGCWVEKRALLLGISVILVGAVWRLLRKTQNH